MVDDREEDVINSILSLPNRIKILYDLEKLKSRRLCKSDILRELGYELVGNNYKILDLLEKLKILNQVEVIMGISFFRINHRRITKIIINWEFYKKNVSIYNWRIK